MSIFASRLSSEKRPNSLSLAPCNSLASRILPLDKLLLQVLLEGIAMSLDHLAIGTSTNESQDIATQRRSFLNIHV